MAAGPQGHRRAEGEGRQPSGRSCIPRRQECPPAPRERCSTRHARRTSAIISSVSETRQQHAEPAIEPAQHVDPVEQRTQELRAPRHSGSARAASAALHLGEIGLDRRLRGRHALHEVSEHGVGLACAGRPSSAADGDDELHAAVDHLLRAVLVGREGRLPELRLELPGELHDRLLVLRLDLLPGVVVDRDDLRTTIAGWSAWKNFRNSQNLPSTPDTAEVDTPETAPDDSAAMVHPMASRRSHAVSDAHILRALVGTRILMPFSASSASALTFRCRY